MFFVMAAFMTVAAGVGVLGAVMLFAPILLFGFLSGLSFFWPRVSAVLALLLVLPFLYVGLMDFLYPSPASEPIFILLPSLLVTLVSGLVIWLSDNSLWSKVSNTSGRAVVLVAALAPTLYTIYALVRFFSSVTFVKNS